MSTQKRRRRKVSVRRIVRSAINTLSAVLVMFTAAFVVMCFVTDSASSDTMQRPFLAIDPNAGDKVVATPAPTEPGVAISGWGKLTLSAGATEVATSLPNPIENDGWYYLTYELCLKETEEVLFTTGLIPPGQYCNAVTLSRALEPGEYPALIRVQPYRMSDQSPTNNAELETLLIVE